MSASTTPSLATRPDTKAPTPARTSLSAFKAGPSSGKQPEERSRAPRPRAGAAPGRALALLIGTSPFAARASARHARAEEAGDGGRPAREAIPFRYLAWSAPRP